MALTRRERLMRSLRGESVDRPPVSFYEIDGLQDMNDPDPFNIFSHASWRPLIELARAKTDLIQRRGVAFKNAPCNPLEELQKTETHYDANGSRFATHTLRAGQRTLTCRTRQDREVATVWVVEHWLKDADDVRAYLDLPESPLAGEPDIDGIIKLETDLGAAGIAMIDTGDPICSAAAMFEMGAYMVLALTEPELFRRLIDRFAREYLWRTEQVAKALPGRLWRICGPEYASPPYLPPALFRDYVTAYDTPMVAAIQKYGGYARIHSHGRLKDILDDIAATGCVGLDPIEPPPQGDVELGYVRRKYGRQMTLFGNLEASDLENLPTPSFAKKIETALREGTAGAGRGFVLMPSASPYGRVLSPLAMRNYEEMVAQVEGWEG